MRNGREQPYSMLVHITVPGGIGQAVEMHSRVECGFGFDTFQRDVVEVGSLPFDLGWIADIWEARPQDKCRPVEVVKMGFKGFLCNQDVCHWPGHGDDFTRFAERKRIVNLNIRVFVNIIDL